MDRFEESLRYAEIVAGRLGVSSEVHRKDFIYEFLLNHPQYPVVEKAVTEYF